MDHIYTLGIDIGSTASKCVMLADGKEIVARDNEVAALRSVNPSKAYFNCHTDITIPYDELAELTAVKKDGGRIAIIKNGKFVLPGTEELNEPLQELS